MIVLVDEAAAAITELNAAGSKRDVALFHGNIEIAPVDPGERRENQDDLLQAPDEWRVRNDRLNKPMDARLIARVSA